MMGCYIKYVKYSHASRSKKLIKSYTLLMTMQNGSESLGVPQKVKNRITK